MRKISRRDAVGLLLTAGAVPLAAGARSGVSQTIQAAYAGKHVPKALPFDPGKLKGLSEKLIRSHHENNYLGAVKALNFVEQKLAAMSVDPDLPAYVYGDLKREELFRTGSVVLHERYFANLGGNGRADGAALTAINRTWGSYGAWESEFKRVANALGGGSGWAIFGFNAHTGEYHNYWSADHASNAPFTIPLLVLDMYEHAYHMDYGAAAAKYVDAFMANVNWDEINRRVETAGKLHG
jgi:Fe-Mn family superoxide dismutase